MKTVGRVSSVKVKTISSVSGEALREPGAREAIEALVGPRPGQAYQHPGRRYVLRRPLGDRQIYWAETGYDFIYNRVSAQVVQMWEAARLGRQLPARRWR